MLTESKRARRANRRNICKAVIDPAAVAASLLIAGSAVVGQIADVTEVYRQPVTPAVLRSTALTSLNVFAVAYIVTLVVFGWADRYKSGKVLAAGTWHHAGIPGLYRVLTEPFPASKSWWATALHYWPVIFLAWIPWIVICWPGGLRDDTFAQLMQSEGLIRFYTQHPITDTLIFDLFWHLGALAGSYAFGIFAYIIVQGLLLSLMSAAVLGMLRQLGVPAIFELTALAFFMCCYVIFGSIPTMGKDSFYTIFFVMVCLFIFDRLLLGPDLQLKVVGGRSQRDLLTWFLLFLSVVFAVAAKRTALPIILGAAVTITYMSNIVVRDVRKLVTVLGLGLVVAVGILEPVLVYYTDATKSAGREVYGLLSQPLTRIAIESSDVLTPSDYAKINRFMDLSLATSTYNPSRTDESVMTLNETASTSDKLSAASVLVSACFKVPTECIKAYTGPIYGWFDIEYHFSYPPDSNYLFTPQYIDQWKGMIQDPTQLDHLNFLMDELVTEITPAQENMRSWVIDREQLSVFNSPALYVTMIPIAVLSYLISRREWIEVSAFSLLFLTVCSLYLSPLSLFWYAIPVYFVIPLFLGLIFAKNGHFKFQVRLVN
jgi:hypothetical protein